MLNNSNVTNIACFSSDLLIKLFIIAFIPLVPVVAVDVIQPAALLDHCDVPGHVAPRGKAVQPLVLVSYAGLDAGTVSLLLRARAVVVLHALARIRASQDGACTEKRKERHFFKSFAC